MQEELKADQPKLKGSLSSSASAMAGHTWGAVIVDDGEDINGAARCHGEAGGI